MARINSSRHAAVAAAVWLLIGPLAAANAPAILDASKLHAGNVTPAGSVRYTAPYVLEAGDSSIALDAYVQPAFRGRPLRWTSGGQPLANGRLAVKAPPGDNQVAAHRIEVAAGDGARDEFTLVLIPASTPVQFNEWLDAERKDMAWIRGLPPVYSSLLPGGRHPEPETCAPKLWPVLRSVSVHYHPGAAYEMRSAIAEDGSGHQATYDAEGKLIREGLGAGSADRAAPRPYNLFRLIAHRDRDVVPFVWAAQLDGNPVNAKALYVDLDAPIVHEGAHLKAYYSVRPAFNPSRKEIPAGTCGDGSAPRSR